MILEFCYNIIKGSSINIIIKRVCVDSSSQFMPSFARVYVICEKGIPCLSSLMEGSHVIVTNNSYGYLFLHNSMVG